MKPCGSCTLCCKTLGVEELGKAPHQWCSLCAKGAGCTIYPDRPKSCREFNCVWKQADMLDERFRPDKLGVVFQPTTDGHGLVAHCDPGTPTAWRTPLAMQVLKACARAGEHASARSGNRYWIITTKGEYEADPSWVRHGPNNHVSIVIPAEIGAEIGIPPRLARRARL